MKHNALIAALLLMASPAAAQTTDGSYGKAHLIDTLTSKNWVTEIEFVTPRIVNVRRYRTGCTVPRRDVLPVCPSQDVPVTITEGASTIDIVAEGGAGVRYTTSSGLITFLNEAGTAICRERSGSTALTAKQDAGEASYTVRQGFKPNGTERFYGLGQVQNGALSQRGRSYNYMIQGNMQVWMPYIHSTRGYALLWNNASPSSYTDNSDGLTFEAAVGYGVDYYFLLGSPDDGAQTVAQMRTLTGQVPLAPLWAYGYFQSKERYQSAKETMGVAATYRRQHVPLDCVVQDWQYWGDNNMWNGMEFTNPRFSNYQQMIDSVHAMNAHMIISTWANFGPDTKPYATMKKNGWLMKQGDQIMTVTYPGNSGVAVYDPYSEGARDAYWQYLWNGLISKGVDGYWLDSSEPDHYQGGTEMEQTFDHQVGLGCSWRAVRNAFPLMHVGGVYDHHRAQPELADKRCLILTRSAYLGQQRTGANTWSGDVSASWETLRNQIPAALNFTACGNPNWNSDIGAFFNGSLGGPGNEEYNELYARWFQFATFCPMMRSHGSGTDKAIYVWGSRGSQWWDNVERYIRLRYTLMPYIYSTAWAVHSRGESFMNALGLLYPKDATALDTKDEYLFGRSLLVAPVMSYKARTRSVYLPKGDTWTDFWSGKTYAGGKKVSVEAALDTMPLFVRTGTILPMQRVTQYADVSAWDTLQLRVYPGADGTLTLYSDAGDGYAYELGEYSAIPITWSDEARTLTIGATEGTAVERVFDIVLVSAGQATGDQLSTSVVRVRYNGTPITVNMNEAQPEEVDYHNEIDDSMDEDIDTGKLVRYTFSPRDWTTGDPSRVSQSNISYSTKNNTITVRAKGTNNIALQLSSSKNNIYYLPQGNTWMWVKASGISTTPSDSRIWFAFGNWVGEVEPQYIYTHPDGDIVVAWNMASRVGEQLLEPYMTLATGGQFIFCFGLTAPSGSAIIKEINFGTEAQLNAFATPVTAPTASATPTTDYYNLAGQRIDAAALHPGVYITRGRKVAVK